MRNENQFWGGVLLVSGTTIGGGMLAVPITTAYMGFVPSLILFGICWIFLLMSAFFFIDVNLAYKDETNMISMAGRTLGPLGQGVAWIFYMLLLYALMAAYISISGKLFQTTIMAMSGYELPLSVTYFLLPLIFSGFVYLGTHGVDLINRYFMAGLLISYGALILFVPSHIEFSQYTHFDLSMSGIGVPVLITSFGYHIVIPSLSSYMGHDKKKLRRCVTIGSLITLAVYAIWQLLVIGVVPLSGEISLAKAWQDGSTAAQPLAALLHQNWVAKAAHFFSFFAIVTSFLGVSLSLKDFLIDGFKIKKTWEGKLGACFLTFIPPLIFVFTFQRGFIMALDYAGAFVAVLLVFLPAAMALGLKKSKFYRSFKGRALAGATILFALLIILIDLLNGFGYFKNLMSQYV